MANTAKGKSNALKNRYRFPPNGLATPISWRELLDLEGPDASIVHDKAAATVVSVNLPDIRRYVSFAAYVHNASATGSENCNCGASSSFLTDTHVDVYPGPDEVGKPEEKVIVETQRRVRILAKEGFLTGVNMEDPNDWSSRNLAQMEGKWVRFKGWLFYDADHFLEDFKSDPNDNLARKNWRATCWELHPVMSIEILSGPPPDM